MTGHSAPPPWLVFLAARWKAVAALVLTLAGAVAQIFPNNTQVHAAFGFATMLAATFGVHRVENADPPSDDPSPTGPPAEESGA